MAGGINSVLSQAKSSLSAAQVAMATTAKNVSNVNTEGYSRQRVELVAGVPEEMGRQQVGGGVEVGNITRSTNEFVHRRLVEEQSALGKFQGLSDIYSQLEMVFKDDAEGSVTQSVSQFFNNLRTLSTQPDSAPLRTAVKEAAKSVTHRFNSMSESMDQVVSDIDARLEGSIADINRLTDRIAHLNNQIVSTEVKGSGTSANDDRDQRDIAVLELSKLVDIKTTALENGSINVTIGNLGPIVMGSDRQELAAMRSPTENSPDSVRVFLMSEFNTVPPKDITEKFESGQVGGLLNLRDKVLPEFRSKVDGLAYNLASSINGVHEGGFTRNGKQGISFFDQPASQEGAAGRLRLSTEVESDVSNIATADASNSAGDNRAILRMTDLETAKVFDGGMHNFNDMASSIVGSLGVQVRSANDTLETQKGIVEQLDTLQKTTSGVSLDEEAMNMLKFQKAFDASAKMIQVADQMMDTIINLKRY